MDIMDEIKMDLEDEMDIYSDGVVNELEENSEINPKEAAFMRGFNKLET